MSVLIWVQTGCISYLQITKDDDNMDRVNELRKQRFLLLNNWKPFIHQIEPDNITHFATSIDQDLAFIDLHNF